MTLIQELQSWTFPASLETSPIPSIGSKAPSTPTLQFPRGDGKPTILTFLRHCGCPFAERSFLNLRSIAQKHPEYHYVAVSHSSQSATEKWLQAIADGSSEADNRVVSERIKILVDEERRVYAKWGLGVASTWHVLSPASLLNVWKLGKDDGIWNRPTESGSRWQTGGSFAVDGKGLVRWVRVNSSADEVVDFGEAAETLDEGSGK